MISHDRVVHAFTCAGVLPTQYCHFSTFAGLGRVGGGYIRHGSYTLDVMKYWIVLYTFLVYNKRGYIDVVSKQAEASMVKAIKEVQALPNFASTGEVSWMFWDCDNVFYV